MIKSLALLGSTLAATLAFTGAAHAATGYERVGAFNEAAPDGSQPAHQRRIAVNQASGDIYTTDVIDDRVEVYTPGAGSATALTTFGTGVVTDPYGIAIDQSNGDVYVSDDNDIVKFTSDGAATPTFTQDNTFTSPGVTGPLAFDQDSDQLLVADRATNTIRRYNANGTVPVTGATFDGSAGDGSPGAFVGLQDLAVDSTGDLIVVDAMGEPDQEAESVSRVERFGANGEWKATIGPVDRAAAVAVRPGSDEVLVSGNQNAVYIGAPPSVTIFTAAGAQLGTLLVDATYAIITGIAADDGADGRMYVATDNGDYRGGGPQYIYGPISVQIFAEFEIQPPIVTAPDAEALSFGARVSGTVDPNQDDTTWTFEYGKTTEYGDQAPVSPRSAGAGGDPVPVTDTITGLEPETTYHYRLTATNRGGTSHSADRTFTTGRGIATSNARDRAFEQVSPQDKGGQSVTDLFASQARADGDVVAYPSLGAFPGVAANVAPGYYIGRRSESGWTTASVEAPQFNPLAVVLQPTQWFSDDLSATVQFSARALAPGAYEKGGNLYLRNNLTGGRTFMAGTAEDVRLAADFAGVNLYNGHPVIQGATPSLSHFGFTTYAPLLPGVSANRNAYEYANGQLRLVGILPDGSIPAGGSNLGAGWNRVSNTPRPVSSDGRRVFFSSPATDAFAPIYMRVDGQSTVAISVSHRTGASPDPVDASYIGASVDGSIVYFASEAMLTDEDAAGIYRLDVDTDELTLITRTPGYPGYEFARDVTADGSTIAFRMGSVQAPGAVDGVANEYVSRNGHITYLGKDFGTGGFEGLALSPDGRYAVYTTPLPLTGYRGSCPTKGNPSGTCTQVYRTDLDGGVTMCVSCVTGRDGNSDLGNQSRTVSMHSSARVLDDGTVLFESDAPLVSGDVNGNRDVYEYVGDTLRLVSSGKAPVRSLLADASPDGRDVFFITTERLVRSDIDTSSDLYDARRGGGIPAQNQVLDAAEACDGDSCQGTPTVSGAVPGVGSVAFTGPGDGPSDDKSPKSVGAVKVTKPKTVRGSTGALKVKLPSAGRITVSGSGTRAVNRAVSQPSSMTVKVVLTAKARQTLKRRGVFKTRLRIAFTPTSGKAQVAAVSVTFEVKR